jgi:hypothetical protein
VRRQRRQLHTDRVELAIGISSNQRNQLVVELMAVSRPRAFADSPYYRFTTGGLRLRL